MKMHGRIRLLSAGMALILLLGTLPMVALGVEGDDVSSAGGQESGVEPGGETNSEEENEFSGAGDIESEEGEAEGGESEEKEAAGDEPAGDEVEDGKAGDAKTGGGEAENAEAENDVPAPLSSTCSGKITVDGSMEDWKLAGISSAAVGEGDNSRGISVTGVRAARDTDGTVYLCLEGSANAYSSITSMTFCVTQNGGASWVFVQQFGGAYAYECDANGSSYAPFILELSIPADYFTDPNYVISFNGCNFPAQAIPVLDGIEQEKDPVVPVYGGIEIDGSYDDWAAVTKYPASDPNNCIDQAAMVFDGNSVYVYLHEVSGGFASGAGSHSNGMYAITTDLGRTLVFQLTADGAVKGVEGASAEHIGSQWEVRIPASELPYYLNTLSFGLYLGDVFVADAANLDGSGGNAGAFNGIVIDGQYGDWSAYPHDTIEYATSGTNEVMVDSEGALYIDNGKLYGHAATTMPDHLDAEGGDFLAAISIAFNGDRDFKEYPQGGNFYPCMLNDDGSISIVNESTHLENGTHTFLICDTRTVGTGEEARIFGTMMVTVTGSCDQMEFELDLEKIAGYIGCSVSDLKMVEAQFGRLGQQWLSIAGTSSGPWLGLAVCAALCTGVLLVRKRKGAASK